MHSITSSKQTCDLRPAPARDMYIVTKLPCEDAHMHVWRKCTERQSLCQHVRALTPTSCTEQGTVRLASMWQPPSHMAFLGSCRTCTQRQCGIPDTNAHAMEPLSAGACIPACKPRMPTEKQCTMAQVTAARHHISIISEPKVSEPKQPAMRQDVYCRDKTPVLPLRPPLTATATHTEGDRQMISS